jgi:hypothetical protein
MSGKFEGLSDAAIFWYNKRICWNPNLQIWECGWSPNLQIWKRGSSRPASSNTSKSEDLDSSFAIKLFRRFFKTSAFLRGLVSGSE